MDNLDNDDVILSNEKKLLKHGWLLSIVILIFLSWLFFQQDPGEIEKRKIVGCFVGLGLLMVFVMIRRTLAYDRIGNAVLYMDPIPGSVGGQIGGKIKLKSSASKKDNYLVSVRCMRLERQRGDKPEQPGIFWSKNLLLATERGYASDELTFVFDIPPDLPLPSVVEYLDRGSYKKTKLIQNWVVVLRYYYWGAEIEVTFNIPVSGDIKKSKYELSRSNVDKNNERIKKEIKSITKIEELNNGINMSFNTGYVAMNGVFHLIFGAMFVALLYGTKFHFMSYPFAVVGIFLMVNGLYSFFKSKHIKISDGNIFYEINVFGITTKNVSASMSEFSPLRIAYGGQTNNNGYCALLTSSKRYGDLAIAENINGYEVALVLREFIASKTGWPVDSAYGEL